MVKVPKSVRNTFISAITLIVLFVIGGILYVLIGDRSNQPATAPKTNQATQQFSEIKPQAPAANAPEGVAIESLVTPVAAGQNTTFSIRTNPTSTCTISVIYNNVPSRDSGLSPKTADAYGFVSWTWTVDRTAPTGTWPATVTCVYHGRSGVAIGNLQVTR